MLHLAGSVLPSYVQETNVIRQCSFYVLFMSCYYPPIPFMLGDIWFQIHICDVRRDDLSKCDRAFYAYTHACPFMTTVSFKKNTQGSLSLRISHSRQGNPGSDIVTYRSCRAKHLISIICKRGLHSRQILYIG